jgi:O-antigen/teichoic acid export membrane protein
VTEAKLAAMVSDVTTYAASAPPRIRRLARDIAWSGAGDVVGKAAVLLTTVAAAHGLSPSAFGLFVGLSASVLISAALADFGMSQLVTREYAIAVRPLLELTQDVVRARYRTVWLGVGAFALSVVVLDRVGHIPVAALAGFAVAAAAYSSSLIALGILRAQLRFRSAAAALAAGRLTTAALTVGVFVLGRGSLTAIGACVAAGEGTTLLTAVAMVVVRTRRLLALEQTRDHTITLRAALPFAANGLLSTIYNRLDVVLIAALASASQLPAYAAASRVQDALYLVPFALTAVGVPAASHAYRDGGREAVGRLVRKLIAIGGAVSAPLAVAGFLLSRTVVVHVLGSGYQTAGRPLQIIVWFLPFAAVQAPLFAGLIALGHAADTSKVIAVTFLVAVGLHAMLDPQFGAVGGAVATLSRDLVATPVVVLLAARRGLLGSVPTVRLLPARERG